MRPVLFWRRCIKRDVDMCACVWQTATLPVVKAPRPSNGSLSQPAVPFLPSHVSDPQRASVDLWHMPHTDDLTPFISHSLPAPQAWPGTQLSIILPVVDPHCSKGYPHSRTMQWMHTRVCACEPLVLKNSLANWCANLKTCEDTP